MYWESSETCQWMSHSKQIILNDAFQRWFLCKARKYLRIRHELSRLEPNKKIKLEAKLSPKAITNDHTELPTILVPKLISIQPQTESPVVVVLCKCVLWQWDRCQGLGYQNRCSLHKACMRYAKSPHSQYWWRAVRRNLSYCGIIQELLWVPVPRNVLWYLKIKDD